MTSSAGRFKDVWAQFDPQRTGFIEIAQIAKFLQVRSVRLYTGFEAVLNRLGSGADIGLTETIRRRVTNRRPQSPGSAEDVEARSCSTVCSSHNFRRENSHRH